MFWVALLMRAVLFLPVGIGMIWIGILAISK